jgi:hypothetical protein
MIYHKHYISDEEYHAFIEEGILHSYSKSHIDEGTIMLAIGIVRTTKFNSGYGYITYDCEFQEAEVINIDLFESLN